MQVSIASLVGELSLQWINPEHHRVRLFMESTKIFVSSPCRKRFQKLQTFVYTVVTKEYSYRQSFFSEFSFLLEHRSMPGAKTIP